ncbi:hypothetical protein CC1G_12868 [Coprinopsis cinerea okayama7|uniref:Uncharacterized protein n=1 Tax=Coprinopsis cinerea (strain Okayama-7 / 130 / ATCC MYA-4618 / FGSC 9003) TaxID=240176 RepID=A8P8F1_COPC7|nr:hypothetical protein CC1G_12868 [Coprinopsis cinerea okayama7\|eukprot:XP_001839557.1 hypothetical protein CC1G_12868 [Coprinopsis cinerea okayama7\
MRFFATLSFLAAAAALVVASPTPQDDAVSTDFVITTAPLPPNFNIDDDEALIRRSTSLEEDALFARATCGGPGTFTTAQATSFINAWHPDPATFLLPQNNVVIISNGDFRVCIYGSSTTSLTVKRSTVGWAAKQIRDTCCGGATTCWGGLETGTAVGYSSPNVPVRLRPSAFACV